jgi:hypothetical protein
MRQTTEKAHVGYIVSVTKDEAATGKVQKPGIGSDPVLSLHLHPGYGKP